MPELKQPININPRFNRCSDFSDLLCYAVKKRPVEKKNWLKGSKIKRKCFLMIIEFTFVSKPEILS